VGKTTVAIGLAAAAAAGGERVLLVDADPQGHATVALGRAPLYSAETPNLASVMMGESPGVGLAELVDLDAWRGLGFLDGRGRLDLLPACPAMFLVEPRLTAERGREFRLARLLAASGFEDHYDLVLIDCPPSLGTLTDNALIATREVLIVAAADPASGHGLDLLVSQIRSLRDALDVDVTVAGLVVNLTENTVVSRESIDAFTQLGLPIISEIPKRVRLKEAWRAGVPIQDLQDPSAELPLLFAELAGKLGLGLGVEGGEL